GADPPRVPALATDPVLAAADRGGAAPARAHARPVRPPRRAVVVHGGPRRAPDPAGARRPGRDRPDDDLAGAAGARGAGPAAARRASDGRPGPGARPDAA